MTASLRRGPGLLAALACAAATLTACSGSDGPTESPTATLAAAKESLDATSGVRIGLSTPELPSGVSGLLSASGIGTHPPAFAGDIKVSASGVTADAEVVAVRGLVYAKLPFSSSFAPIDPAEYGAPDPAALMRPAGGLSSLLTESTGVKRGEEVREGESVLRSFTAAVPGDAVAAVIPSASPEASFDARFTIDDGDRLSKAVLSGPFYPRTDDVTYTITFAEYGTKRTITAPRATRR
ncbi:MAG TPA: LppX_LprAFG lipoprotein [Nocardioidaceae bacterium]|nr:LppX_LprAFG lipoprotein [Nocardioidaceae bacterium]